MVVAPGEWEPGINCEGELSEFSGLVELLQNRS